MLKSIFAWILFAGLLESACGSGAECILDSDCPIGKFCSKEQKCVLREPSDRDSGPIDAFTPPLPDAGPRMDMGVERRDAQNDASEEASASQDSMPEDTHFDAGVEDTFDASFDARSLP
ncbi:MAG: hypothetical protein NZM37_07465 [Sandaracinaceae bacterium]|nr:hypothetical protein [Sandaracinaceae bacterium]MDW8245477.1 hypothetical protein [Sandaracinaceae bacterium]